MRDHSDFFQIFFQDQGMEFETELESLASDGTYAGQECIIALAQTLGVNIMVTYGGDNNNDVFTMEHPSPNNDAGDLTLHIVFSSLGGGHYDVVIESQQVPSSDLPTITKQYDLTKERSSFKETQFSQIKTNLQEKQNTFSNKQKSTTDLFDNLKCKFCGTSFAQRCSLKRHYEMKHLLTFQSKPWGCICQGHVNIHTYLL